MLVGGDGRLESHERIGAQHVRQVDKAFFTELLPLRSGELIRLTERCVERSIRSGHRGGYSSSARIAL